MTSFVAWTGINSGGSTSLYFASDSRISWGNTDLNWDAGRKLFACRTSPEIFGFVGYLLLPQGILQQCCDLIDSGVRPKELESTAQLRADWLYSQVEASVDQHPKKLMPAFTIFYATRVGIGKLEATQFHLFAISWNSITEKLSMNEIQVPLTTSSMLHIDGTGKKTIGHWNSRWFNSDQGATSRAMFSAFCDALGSGKDKFSGGEPQLVGFYRKGFAKTFGIVSKNGASYLGKLVPNFQTSSSIEWRDSLFQRVDQTGALLKGAQPHSRPKQVNVE